MTQDEVRMLDNKYAILFIRGERPIMDLKYDILKHPNVSKTTDGKSAPYIHGNLKNVNATMTILEGDFPENDLLNFENVSHEYVLLSPEEVEKYILEKRKRKNEKKL